MLIFPASAAAIRGGWGASAVSALPRAEGLLQAGASELRDAAASLLQGSGPALGAPVSCAPAGASEECGSGSAAPGAPAAGPHPLVATLPDWSPDPMAPGARNLGALAYDPVDKYVLLFGGYNGSFLSDTWTYNGVWTQLHPKTAPSVRDSPAMAFDYKDGYMVLFGGYAGASPFPDDTWTFIHGSWTHIHPASSPTAVTGAGFAWDVADSYLVLFGGSTNTSAASNQTWTFVGGIWTHQHPTTSPPVRGYVAMAYDPTNHYVVLFGGLSAGAASTPQGTWTFSAGKWSQLHPATQPSGVWGGTLANDSADGYLVLYGGQNVSSNKYVAKTWSFVNGTWTQQSPATPPGGRFGPSLVFDKAQNRLLLFGGARSTGTELGDTWSYHANVWTRGPTLLPQGTIGGMMVYDEADGYVLYFGGAVIHGGLASFFAGTWTYTHGHWSQLHPSISPTGRNDGAMTYDAADGYVLLFGGIDASAGLLGDTWSFHAGKWTPLNVSPSPAARYWAGMAYDAIDGYVVMFGGLTGSGELNDTWLFSGGAWTLWIPNACSFCGADPGARYAMAMVYDAGDEFVLMFGGINTAYVNPDLSDTWTFSGGTWTNITGTVGSSPGGRGYAAATYDGIDDYVLLQGGYSYASGEYGDTWSFSGGSWTMLSPAMSPGNDLQAQMAFDPVDKTVVYLAGQAASGTWLY